MKKFVIGCGLLLACCAQQAFAVPANRSILHTVVQPDGTTIQLKLIGDEFAHCYVTEDGLPVVEGGDGVYRYAMLDAQGAVITSDVKPTSPSLRGAAESFFVKSLDAQAIRSAVLAPRAEASRMLKSRKAPASRANQSSGIGLSDVKFPSIGDVHSIVILVDYEDKKFTMDDPGDYFNRHLNEEGFSENGATGSVRDYFIESSLGKFSPTFDVFGPVALPHNYKYYGENDQFGSDKRAEQMVIDACNMLDSIVDFSHYDLDEDGKVDNIFIIYAGRGEANGGNSNTVWPHQWDLSSARKTLELDGVNIDHYGCANELSGNKPDGIGTFVHEFSHVMGLPDLYTTDYSSATSLTPGAWNVLDYGPYNNDGRTPPAYSIFERNALGWIDPIVLKGEDTVTLHDIRTTNEGAIALTNRENEFFLFENRQQSGSDKFIPGHGMLIWHIDYNASQWWANTVNNSANHQYVDIEEANGRADNGLDIAMAGYAFPGVTGNTSFTDETKPNMLTWSGASLGLPITNIAESEDGVITFDVNGGKLDLTAPTLRLTHVDAGSFTIEWKPVAKAENYTVQIYNKEGGSITNLREFKSEASAFSLDRLEPETSYYAVVTAHKGSSSTPASDELEITTSEFDFTLAIPKANEAEGIEEAAFTASWEELREAEEYLLTVTTLSGKNAITESTGFGSGSKLELPEGWSSTSNSTYTGAIYCGQSAPSLKLDKDQASLQTRLYDSDVRSVKFWTRINASGSTSKSYLTVQGRGAEGEEWSTILLLDEIDTTSKGQTVEIDDIAEGVRQVRFLYTKVTGNLALDDVEINVGGISDIIYLDYDAKTMGKELTHTVEIKSLEDGTWPLDFTYTVQARDAKGRTSLHSDPIKVNVRTDGVTKVPVEADPSAPVEYYNLQGVRIATPTAPGIYIRRQGPTAQKVRL